MEARTEEVEDAEGAVLLQHVPERLGIRDRTGGGGGESIPPPRREGKAGGGAGRVRDPRPGMVRRTTRGGVDDPYPRRGEVGDPPPPLPLPSACRLPVKERGGAAGEGGSVILLQTRLTTTLRGVSPPLRTLSGPDIADLVTCGGGGAQDTPRLPLPELEKDFGGRHRWSKIFMH